jgi:hypothetical protein
MPSNLLFTADKPLTAEQFKAVATPGEAAESRIGRGGAAYQQPAAGREPGAQPRDCVQLVQRPRQHRDRSAGGSVQGFSGWSRGTGSQRGHHRFDHRGLPKHSGVSEPSAVYTAPLRITSRVPFSPVGFVQPAGPTLVSTNVPSLLFEDMSLNRPSGDIPRLPFSTHPFFDR